MKETLELQFNSLRGEWYLCDTRGFHIGTMRQRSEAERYALEMGYRLRIDPGNGKKLEWFN